MPPRHLFTGTAHRPGSVRLGLTVATLLAGVATRPAMAQATNGNPGGSLFVSRHVTESLTFAAPVQTTSAVSAAVTEIIARLNGGPALYDVTIPDAFGSIAVQAAAAAGTAALLAAGGSGTVVTGPLLLSQASSTNSTSSSLYTLDPSTPAIDSNSNSIVNLGTFPYVTTSSQTIFGPTVVQGAVAGQMSTSSQPGVYGLCTVRTLPSATAPTCSAFDGGTIAVAAGQTNVEFDIVVNYLIDTATTVTTTTTTRQVYEVDGTRAGVPVSVPEPGGWPVFVLGLAATGLMVWRRNGALRGG